jgi:hypothetical protein
VILLPLNLWIKQISLLSIVSFDKKGVMDAPVHTSPSLAWSAPLFTTLQVMLYGKGILGKCSLFQSADGCDFTSYMDQANLLVDLAGQRWFDGCTGTEKPKLSKMSCFPPYPPSHVS